MLWERVLFWLKVSLSSVWMAIISTLAVILLVFNYRSRFLLTGRMGRLIGKGVLRICGVELEVRGTRRFPKEGPYLVAGNHQSIVDTATYVTLMPDNAVMIGKKEILKIPFFGVAYKLTGNVLLDRKNPEVAIEQLREAAEAIKLRKAVALVFPEGTRNRKGGGFLPFKKGPFYLARDAEALIVPVVSSPAKPVFDWENRRIPGGRIIFEVLEPVRMAGLSREDIARVKEELRERMLKTYEALDREISASVSS